MCLIILISLLVKEGTVSIFIILSKNYLDNYKVSVKLHGFYFIEGAILFFKICQ